MYIFRRQLCAATMINISWQKNQLSNKWTCQKKKHIEMLRPISKKRCIMIKGLKNLKNKESVPILWMLFNGRRPAVNFNCVLFDVTSSEWSWINLRSCILLLPSSWNTIAYKFSSSKDLSPCLRDFMGKISGSTTKDYQKLNNQ